MGYDTVVLADSPNGYWRLGEPSGTVATNQIQANHGTITGGPLMGQPGAVLGGNTAYTFDGVDDFIQLALSPYLGTGPFSIEVWFKCATPSAAKQIFDNRFGNSSSTGVNLEITTTQVTVRIGAFGANYTVSAPVAAYGNTLWHHAVVTYTLGTPDGTVRLYLDGVLIGAAVTSGMGAMNWTGSYAFRFGTISPNASQWFPGSLDELATYNSALTPTQILAHFHEATIVGDALRALMFV